MKLWSTSIPLRAAVWLGLSLASATAHAQSQPPVDDPFFPCKTQQVSSGSEFRLVCKNLSGAFVPFKVDTVDLFKRMAVAVVYNGPQSSYVLTDRYPIESLFQGGLLTQANFASFARCLSYLDPSLTGDPNRIAGAECAEMRKAACPILFGRKDVTQANFMSTCISDLKQSKLTFHRPKQLDGMTHNPIQQSPGAGSPGQPSGDYKSGRCGWIWKTTVRCKDGPCQGLKSGEALPPTSEQDLCVGVAHCRDKNNAWEPEPRMISCKASLCGPPTSASQPNGHFWADACLEQALPVSGLLPEASQPIPGPDNGKTDTQKQDETGSLPSGRCWQDSDCYPFDGRPQKCTPAADTQSPGFCSSAQPDPGQKTDPSTEPGKIDSSSTSTTQTADGGTVTVPGLVENPPYKTFQLNGNGYFLPKAIEREVTREVRDQKQRWKFDHLKEAWAKTENGKGKSLDTRSSSAKDITDAILAKVDQDLKSRPVQSSKGTTYYWSENAQRLTAAMQGAGSTNDFKRPYCDAVFKRCEISCQDYLGDRRQVWSANEVGDCQAACQKRKNDTLSCR